MNNRSTIDYYPLLFVALCLLLASCSNHPDANTIVDKAIQKAGGQKFAHSRIRFTFRGRRYQIQRQAGHFVYERIFKDSTGAKITDRLTNKGFRRQKKGQLVHLSAKDSAAYANSLNSVVYYALLPYKLNDAAVNKKYLGKTKINGAPYYEIGVRFAKKGGGKDYDDSFVYWINRDNYNMDYMAYRFHVNKGGTRFRQAKNIRRIKGIRFTDYNNYGGPDMQRPLKKYDTYFKADTLKKVSEINLENIEVRLLNKKN